MQGVHLDPNSWENPNGEQFAKKRMATPGTLCSMQWALEDRSSLMYMLPFRKSGLEPSSHLGELGWYIGPATGRPTIDYALVGEGR
jgi:hypothetical protein